MLKPLIILPIVPSNHWLLAQCALFVGLAVLSYWVLGLLAWLALLALGGAFGWRVFTRQFKGVLYLTSTASQFHGRWLLPGEQPPVRVEPVKIESRAVLPSDALSEDPNKELSEKLSEEHQVRCDYLGPWLIGLYVGKQRIWLWPDSAPAEHLREVRRLFHRPGR
nr:hypothetical protein [uncultured Halomonas sp.]